MADYPSTGGSVNGSSSWPRQHCATSSFSPANHQGGSAPPPPPVARKSTRHRKRHVPVGPAGVWFQNFQQSYATKKLKHPSNDNIDEEEEEDPQDMLQHLRVSAPRQSSAAYDMASFSSPAWIAMQCDCEWVTPSLPTSLTVAERYQHLRPHVPADFDMIQELIDPTSSQITRSRPWFCRDLMVLVSNIHGSATAHGWTVDLTDETGASLTAWVQPDSVRRQLQRPTTTGGDASSSSLWFQTGCVWWLQNTTLFLSPDAASSLSETGTRSLSFLLLVGEENIKQVWNEKDGASLSDEAYLQWMERRSRVAPASFNDHEEGNGDNDDESRQNFNPQRRTMEDRGRLRPQPSVTLPTHQQSQHLRVTRKQSPLRSSARSAREISHVSPSFPSTNHSPKRYPAQPLQNHTSAAALQSATHPLTSQNETLESINDATQQTLSPSHTVNVPTIQSTLSTSLSRRGRASVAEESPFAFFAYSQPEDVTGTPGNNCQRSDNLKRSSTSVQREGQSAHSPNSFQTKTSDTRAKPLGGSSKDETTHATPAARARSLPSSAKTTTSSMTTRGSLSSRKRRRRRTTTSKLWTGDVSLDFSDDDDDDSDGAERSTENELAPSTEKVSETKEPAPPIKRSLFRADALEELANILSSDDDDP